MKERVEGYRNYGVLGYEKQPFYTINAPSPLAVASEKVVFILPKGCKTAKNKAGTILFEIGDGKTWVAEQLLENKRNGNDFTKINIDGFKYYVEVEDLVEESSEMDNNRASENSGMPDSVVRLCCEKLQCPEYMDYVKSNLGAAMDVMRHKGNLHDLDHIIHLEELLNMHISYELYAFLDAHFECSISEIDNAQLLYPYLDMYITQGSHPTRNDNAMEECTESGLYIRIDDIWYFAVSVGGNKFFDQVIDPAVLYELNKRGSDTVSSSAIWK